MWGSRPLSQEGCLKKGCALDHSWHQEEGLGLGTLTPEELCRAVLSGRPACSFLSNTISVFSEGISCRDLAGQAPGVSWFGAGPPQLSGPPGSLGSGCWFCSRASVPDSRWQPPPDPVWKDKATFHHLPSQEPKASTGDCPSPGYSGTRALVSTCWPKAAPPVP